MAGRLAKFRERMADVLPTPAPSRRELRRLLTDERGALSQDRLNALADRLSTGRRGDGDRTDNIKEVVKGIDEEQLDNGTRYIRRHIHNRTIVLGDVPISADPEEGRIPTTTSAGSMTASSTDTLPNHASFSDVEEVAAQQERDRRIQTTDLSHVSSRMDADAHTALRRTDKPKDWKSTAWGITKGTYTILTHPLTSIGLIAATIFFPSWAPFTVNYAAAAMGLKYMAPLSSRLLLGTGDMSQVNNVPTRLALMGIITGPAAIGILTAYNKLRETFARDFNTITLWSGFTNAVAHGWEAFKGYYSTVVDALVHGNAEKMEAVLTLPTVAAFVYAVLHVGKYAKLIYDITTYNRQISNENKGIKARNAIRISMGETNLEELKERQRGPSWDSYMNLLLGKTAYAAAIYYTSELVRFFNDGIIRSDASFSTIRDAAQEHWKGALAIGLVGLGYGIGRLSTYIINKRNEKQALARRQQDAHVTAHETRHDHRNPGFMTDDPEVYTNDDAAMGAEVVRGGTNVRQPTPVGVELEPDANDTTRSGNQNDAF